jgi:hypothetical protein
MFEGLLNSVEKKVAGDGEDVDARINNAEKLFTHLKPFLEQGGYPAISREIFDLANIEPHLLQAENPEFEDMRKRLNTEPGLVICNHPGIFFDFPVVLEALHSEIGDRPDVKILVSSTYAPVYNKLFDKYHFISTEDIMKPSGFKGLLKHIEDGGLVVIFPTGGGEEGTKHRIRFEDGLSAVVKKINSDAMVYSFYIDPEGVSKAMKERPAMKLGVWSGATMMPEANINNLRPRESFDVNEWYSKAGEWQQLIKDNKGKESEALTDFYLEKSKEGMEYSKDLEDKG